MAQPSLAQRLVDALLARGAREIFGIPSDFALPLFRDIERDGRLPILTLAHEPGVGFAADATARVRGALGVAAVTYGAGALNLVNAVAGAYAERGCSSSSRARRPRTRRLAACCCATRSSSWTRNGGCTRRSPPIARASTTWSVRRRPSPAGSTPRWRARPVYLEIPSDLPGQPCAAVPAPAIRTWDFDRVAAAADELLARLRAGRDPLLVVGVHVRQLPIPAELLGRELKRDKAYRQRLSAWVDAQWQAKDEQIEQRLGAAYS